MTDRPHVTRAEFDAIECNRCGACCESVTMPSPLTFAMQGSLNTVAEGGARALDRFGNLPEHDADASYAIGLWFGELIPLEEPHAQPLSSGWWRYRCPRFERDGNGLGACTVHETRNPVCSGFPYGRPNGDRTYVDCSFNVVIAPEQVAPGPGDVGERIEEAAA